MSETDRPPRAPLLAWQWSSYRDAHQQRANLAVHACTVPIFVAGTAAVVAAPWVGPAWAAGGALAAIAAMGAQGRTHKLEATGPAPFRGPADVVLRILAEQWITFPRYVLSGAFLRAWRAGGERARAARARPSLP